MAESRFTMTREGFRRAIERGFEERCPVQCVGSGRTPLAAGRQSVRAPRGVIEFWPEDLVIRVGAATTFTELDGFLSPFGLDLGVVVAEPGRATLGGSFARGEWGMTGAAGRSLRELVLSALVVNGCGEPLELGARVVKNVAGYDLLRLHFGAGGAWGGISDLLLRVRSRPKVQHMRCVFCTPYQALEILQECRRTGGTTTSGEWWVDSGALRELGVQGPGAWFFFAEGGEAEIESWSEAVGGEDSTAQLEELRDLGFLPERGTNELRLVVGASTKAWSAGLERQAGSPGGSRWWVHDAGSGLTRVGIHAIHLRDFIDARKAPVFVESEVLESWGTAAPTKAQRWGRRLRELWDPAAIFPSPPRVIEP
jgi:FAD binding domain